MKKNPTSASLKIKSGTEETTNVAFPRGFAEEETTVSSDNRKETSRANCGLRERTAAGSIVNTWKRRVRKRELVASKSTYLGCELWLRESVGESYGRPERHWIDRSTSVCRLLKTASIPPDASAVLFGNSNNDGRGVRCQRIIYVWRSARECVMSDIYRYSNKNGKNRCYHGISPHGRWQRPVINR